MGRKPKESVGAHPVLLQVIAGKRGKYYSLLQGNSVWIKGIDGTRGHSSKGKQVQIGSIKSSDGVGECELNFKFYDKNPEFIKWRIFRDGVRRYRYIRRDKKDIESLTSLLYFYRAQLLRQSKFPDETKELITSKTDRKAIAKAMLNYSLNNRSVFD